MTEGAEEQKKGEGKGFAGLSMLVSDVDTPPPAAKMEPAAAAPSTERPAPHAAQPLPSQQHQTYQEPVQPPSSGSSGGKWVLGIVAFIGMLWIIGQFDKSKTSPTPAYSPPVETEIPSYSPPAEPQAPSRPEESMPPVGQDVVFSTAQIHYCLAEDIRMEGAKSVLNNYSNSDVDRFNAMVADYNSRCGSFRYSSGALESARLDIETYRSVLQSEGRSRFAHSLSNSPGNHVVPTHSTAGAEEQPMGQVVSSTDGKLKSEIPANAWASGSEWFCNDGYRKAGDICEKLDVPANAWVSGSEWFCNDGYRKAGDICEKLDVPANAWVNGSEWFCNVGYRKVGDICVSIFEK